MATGPEGPEGPGDTDGPFIGGPWINGLFLNGAAIGAEKGMFG